MTYRLVGLMSLVLLLSLAAFAFLVSSYQGNVMGEVTRTVSTVGRATLQTFERPANPAALLRRVPVPSAAATAGLRGYAYEFRTKPPSDGGKPSSQEGVAIIRLNPHTATGEPGGNTRPDPHKLVMVKVEEIHAESGPKGDTVLRIPTWRVEQKAQQADEDQADSMLWVVNGSDDEMSDLEEIQRGATEPKVPTTASGNAEVTQAKDPASNHAAPRDALKTTRQEIVLPIPTREFSDLFAEFRRRTLFLFLGVFVLGTLLSAGLAARFTRPVRRLDAGIRRLSEGDLEVQVEAGGRDEIGRLARAFNEMARRLRAGRERELEMRRREKLSSLGRMAAGVAHDVRNPLHSINLTLQNLQETARPTEAGRGGDFDRSVAIIRAEIHRLDQLVESFLRFARSDRAARIPVDLAGLATETARLVEKEAERRGIRIEVRREGKPGIVEGDVESIRSSVLNLVLNSFEAMPHGGTLTLSVRGGEAETRLEVADTGRGIPEEDQEKVFEFAYTTREDGHGLGLAMVHQAVVEDHGGSVSLQSRPGEGTRVLLAFPATAEPARTERAS